MQLPDTAAYPNAGHARYWARAAWAARGEQHRATLEHTQALYAIVGADGTFSGTLRQLLTTASTIVR